MKKYLLTILCFCFTISSFAQNEREIEICNKAQEYYQLGRLDEAVTFLEGSIKSLSTLPKVTALRVLALCYLEQDQLEQAEKCVSQLLKEDPYYNISLNDPPRFVDLVAQLKRGESAVITTASQQAESLSEVPVPVTLITEEMIKLSGAKNLGDLLMLYVPGLSYISGPEENIAMHGVFSSTQEKILILLDGHRLNSRTTNTEAPDYRTSLAKIKQIEVLRGPASSLYGNVALTAVVNIITKSARDIDGVDVSIGLGDNNTYRSDLVFGKKGMNVETMGWVSFYASEGEKRHLSPEDEDFYGKVLNPGYLYINGYNRRPSFDFGFKTQFNNFKFMITMQEAKKVFSYNSVMFPSLYSYDRYRKYDGINPGHSRRSTRASLTYERNLGKNWSTKINGFIDFENCRNYDVAGDSILPADRYLPVPPGEVINPQDIQGKSDYGVYQVMSWQDYTYGLNANVNYTFRTGKWDNSLLLGLQMENYKMNDNSLMVGDHYDRVVVTYSEANSPIILGDEQNISAFAQFKTRWNEKFIFNGGLRFDHKNRYNEKKINVVSPRISAIYKFSDYANLKLCYSHSFVDAPFIYRASKVATISGDDNLKPEKMDAVQLTLDGALWNGILKYESNLYYNRLSDFIYVDQFKFSNAGTLDLIGWENVLSCIQGRNQALLNISYMRVVDYNKYRAENTSVMDVPNFIMNMMYKYDLMKSRRFGDLSLRANGRFIGRQKSPIGEWGAIFKGDQLINIPENEIGSRCIINLGLNYSFKRYTLYADVYNLFNTQYNQGGYFGFPMPQQGLNFLITNSFHF